jgi:cellobiose-specific phosphotransferase system component IIC
MKFFAKKHLNKMAAASLALATFVSTSASAALSASEQAAIDALALKVSDLETGAWTILIAVMIALIGMSLFKKFVKRAAS